MPSNLAEKKLDMGRVLTVAILLSGCADIGSSTGDAGSNGFGGYGFGGNVSSGGASNIGGNGAGGGPPGAFSYAALCGVDQCTPGGLVACTPQGEGGTTSGGGASGVGGSAGLGGDAGVGGALAGGGAGEGGSTPETYGCQIEDASGSPHSTCEPTGSAIIDGVCNSSADCLPGLGCVLATSAETGEGGGGPAPAIGICRPYCCGDLEACPQSTFCAPKPMFDAAAGLADPTTALPIPVCMPIQSCQLLGSDCPAGQTCSVVRADGSTSCVAIGKGQLCQPCECAEGFICNFGTGQCIKLCDTATNDCPGDGALCEGGTGLPDNIGICIGGDSTCET